MSIAAPVTEIFTTAEEVESNFLTYLRKAERGVTVVILHEGRPLAELKPHEQKLATQRPFGLCAGEFTVPYDFDAPLPEEIIREFEG